MARVARIVTLGVAILLAGAGCPTREEPSTADIPVSAEIEQMDALVAGTDAEDFSEQALDDLDVTVDDDAADAEQTLRELDELDFDDSVLSDDAIGY